MNSDTLFCQVKYYSAISSAGLNFLLFNIMCSEVIQYHTTCCCKIQTIIAIIYFHKVLKTKINTLFYVLIWHVYVGVILTRNVTRVTKSSGSRGQDRLSSVGSISENDAYISHNATQWYLFTGPSLPSKFPHLWVWKKKKLSVTNMLSITWDNPWRKPDFSLVREGYVILKWVNIGQHFTPCLNLKHTLSTSAFPVYVSSLSRRNAYIYKAYEK